MSDQLRRTERPLGPKVFPGWEGCGVLPPRGLRQPGGGASSAGGSAVFTSLCVDAPLLGGCGERKGSAGGTPEAGSAGWAGLHAARGPGGRGAM